MTADVPRPIQVATIAQLLSGEVGAPGSCVHVENLCEGGAYLRRLPFRLDTGALDAAHGPAVEAYFANKITTFDAIRHLIFNDALIVGQGSVVTRDYCLVAESAYEFVAGGEVPDGFADAGQHSSSGGMFTLQSEPAATIDRPTLLLKRPWNANYGHWLVDSAAMAALATGLTLPPAWQLAIGRQDSPAMQQIVRQTLDVVAPHVAVIELPAALSALKALVLHGNLASTGSRRGIYVTRGEHGARRLRNEDEVIALCREFGLDIVRPEQWTLAEQARMFRAADLVVGVKGAALTNALFCSSRTHLVVLTPGDFPDPFYWDLTAPAGIGYSEIFGVLQSRGRPIGHNPFIVSVAGLRTILEACLANLRATDG